MLKHHLTIAFRTLTRNRITSIINIGGLAVGMAVAILIGLWIYDELSFNKYFSNYDAISQVNTHAHYPEGTYTISSQPMPLAQQLRASKAFRYVVMSVHEQHLLSFNGRQFNQQGKDYPFPGPCRCSGSQGSRLSSLRAFWPAATPRFIFPPSHR